MLPGKNILRLILTVYIHYQKVGKRGEWMISTKNREPCFTLPSYRFSLHTGKKYDPREKKVSRLMIIIKKKYKRNKK